MFFPDEPVPASVVRELAALLKENGLGKIALESNGAQGLLRLNLKRDTFALVSSSVATPPDVSESQTSDVAQNEVETPAPQLTGTHQVAAPCVGVYRAPKKPFQIGDLVKKGQVVAVVESLRVPNEVVAPFDGTVVELPSLEGQGVEWGQTLLVLEPAP